MAMTDRDRVDHDLEGFFEAARRTAPEPSPDLLARVLADAARAQARPQPPRPVRQAVGGGTRVPRWRQFVDALGGWPAMAGLVSAGVAGLWLGVNPPDALSVLPLSGFGASDLGLGVMMPGAELDLLALEEG